MYPKDWWTSRTFVTLKRHPILRYVFLEMISVLNLEGGYWKEDKEFLEDFFNVTLSPEDWAKLKSVFIVSDSGIWSLNSVDKRATSPAKIKANQENGPKGGRPPKESQETQNKPNKKTQTEPTETQLTHRNPPLEVERERKENTKEIKPKVLISDSISSMTGDTDRLEADRSPSEKIQEQELIDWLLLEYPKMIKQIGFSDAEAEKFRTFFKRIESYEQKKIYVKAINRDYFSGSSKKKGLAPKEAMTLIRARVPADPDWVRKVFKKSAFQNWSKANEQDFAGLISQITRETVQKVFEDEFQEFSVRAHKEDIDQDDCLDWVVNWMTENNKSK